MQHPKVPTTGQTIRQQMLHVWYKLGKAEGSTAT